MTSEMQDRNAEHEDAERYFAWRYPGIARLEVRKDPSAIIAKQAYLQGWMDRAIPPQPREAPPMADTRTTAELADDLDARAKISPAAWEAVLYSEDDAALDRAASAQLRAMDEALAKIASWPCLGDNHNPMKPAVDGMREAARTARGES